MKQKAFISYSSKDRPKVKEIVKSLDSLGVPLWFDEWEIKVGDSITSKIEKGLEESSYLIVVLSVESVNSQWVQKELNAALIKEIDSKRVVVLPILLEDCQIPSLIRDKKYADFRKSFQEGIESIARVLLPQPDGIQTGKEQVIASFLSRLASFSKGIRGPDFFELIKHDFDWQLWDPADPLEGYLNWEASLTEKGLIKLEGQTISVTSKGLKFIRLNSDS